MRREKGRRGRDLEKEGERDLRVGGRQVEEIGRAHV